MASYYERNKERCLKNSKRNYILAACHKQDHKFRIPADRINEALVDKPRSVGAPLKYTNDEDRKAAAVAQRKRSAKRFYEQLKMAKCCSKELLRLSQIDISIF